MNIKAIMRVVSVFPAIYDAGKFVVDKIKARRKARLTKNERELAMLEAQERLDDILDKVDTKREKRPLK